MEFAKIKKYFNACNPYETASFGSTEIIDIDQFEIDGRKVDVRGGSCIGTIAKQIRLSDNPLMFYFSGYPGSGKTTELAKLQNTLSDEWLCVNVDALEYFDLNSSINEIDIYAAIIHKASLAVGAYTQLTEDQIFNQDGYFGRLWRWLDETNVNLKQAELGTDGAKLVFEMKNVPKFREQVKGHLETHFTKFKNDTMAELERLNNVVKSFVHGGMQKNGLVIIVDSLERNQGVGSKIDEVAQSIERVFTNRSNVELPTHVIYTIPPYLSARGSLGRIEFLPVIKIITPMNEPYADGIEVMKAFAYARIDSEDLQEMLGEAYEERLKQLIAFSGGYPRDFLELLQHVVLVDNYPVDDKSFERIFSKIENQYQEFLPMEYKDELLEIYRTKRIDVVVSSDKHTIAYDLFRNHVILRYQNNELWFSLHPATMKNLGLNESR
jgi:hypothetical protein